VTENLHGFYLNSYSFRYIEQRRALHCKDKPVALVGSGASGDFGPAKPR
jgi:hypothetical protein